MQNLILIIGVAGLAVVLCNLYFLETGREKPKSKGYLTLGATGSLLLATYSWLVHSPIFLVINCIFVILNTYWLLRLNRSQKRRSVRKRRKRS